MSKYHVSYWYLATGMDGQPDEIDYGIVEANSKDEAKTIVADREYPNDEPDVRHFFLGCLSAEEVK